MSPPAAREQVDGGDEEGQQRRDQHELDRPAPDDAIPEPDVARRPLRELEPLVERAEQLLRGAADRPEPLHVERLGHVGERVGGSRSPAVVIVTAGMPRATNGACS